MSRPFTSVEERAGLYSLKDKIEPKLPGESDYEIYERLKAKSPRTPSDRTKLYRLRKRIQRAAQSLCQPQNESEDCNEHGQHTRTLKTKIPLSAAERSRRYRQKKKVERAKVAQNEIKMKLPLIIDDSYQQCKLEKEDDYPDDETEVPLFTNHEDLQLCKQEKQDESKLIKNELPVITGSERIVLFIQSQDHERVNATQNFNSSEIKRPLTGAERTKLYRQRKKIELEHMKVKRKPLTNAERSKRYRQKKKGIFVDVSWPNISVGHPLVDAVIDVCPNKETNNYEEPLIPYIFLNPTTTDPLSTSSNLYHSK